MAQKKMKQLDEPSKASIAQKARRAAELKAISEIADQNLAITDEWRSLLPEHLEAIKVRLVAGDTLGNICRALGLDRGHVCSYVYHNPEFAREYLAFKEFGAHAMWDRLLEMIDDKDMSAGDKMFAYKVINSYTSKINRPVYGESVQVDQNVNITAPVMPDWFFGNVVDGQLSDNSDPTI